MSWVQDVASFTRKLLILESRVEDHSEEIKDLRRELKERRDIDQNIAYVVKRHQERAADRETTMALSLENELLKLERRLGSLGQKTGEG